MPLPMNRYVESTMLIVINIDIVCQCESDKYRYCLPMVVFDLIKKTFQIAIKFIPFFSLLWDSCALDNKFPVGITCHL